MEGFMVHLWDKDDNINELHIEPDGKVWVAMMDKYGDTTRMELGQMDKDDMKNLSYHSESFLSVME